MSSTVNGQLCFSNRAACVCLITVLGLNPPHENSQNTKSEKETGLLKTFPSKEVFRSNRDILLTNRYQKVRTESVQVGTDFNNFLLILIIFSLP